MRREREQHGAARIKVKSCPHFAQLAAAEYKTEILDRFRAMEEILVCGKKCIIEEKGTAKNVFLWAYHDFSGNGFDHLLSKLEDTLRILKNGFPKESGGSGLPGNVLEK